MRSFLQVRVALPAWMLTLGTTGFLFGFFGPLALSPDANQGPLLGLLITGPGGVMAGLLLGTVARALRWSRSAQWRALASCCVLLALATLWFSLPEPRTRGWLLEANVTACRMPEEFSAAALADWDERIAKVTWAAPRAGWKEQAERQFARPDGVVLDLEVSARRAALEGRKPWNRGRISVVPRAGAGDISRVFVRYAGASCAGYPLGPTVLYYEAAHDPKPGPWPPDDLPGLLSLVVAEPPPAHFGGSSSG